MKGSSFIKLLYLLIISIFISSCTNSDNHEFSHDSVINSWVKKNKKELISYNRNMIAELEDNKQRAIMKSYMPLKKKEIWKEKIDYLLNLKISKEEIDFLKWYKEKLNYLDYSIRTPEKLEKEMYERTLEGMTRFG